MLFNTDEHKAMARTTRDFIINEINPHVNEWEEKGAFPTHEVFKRMGELGLLGVTKPEAFGGLELDYSYGLEVEEKLGNCECGGHNLSIGISTNLATPD